MYDFTYQITDCDVDQTNVSDEIEAYHVASAFNKVVCLAFSPLGTASSTSRYTP
jgi:hypothetical protein